MLDLLDPALLHAVIVATGSQGPTPEPEDVKAGWTALAIWIGMAVAVALLGWSLMRQLRKTQAARDAGVFGDVPVTRNDEDRTDERTAGE